jgi:hypothetical protein
MGSGCSVINITVEDPRSKEEEVNEDVKEDNTRAASAVSTVAPLIKLGIQTLVPVIL